MSKVCTKCARSLPLERFSKQSTSKSGYRGICKDCHNTYVREDWYVKNSEKQRKSSKRWKIENRAKVLATKYKCDVETIQKLLDIGECEICGTTENLHIDHCHSSGLVRGILCPGCNKGLGHFSESIQKLSSASRYLTERS